MNQQGVHPRFADHQRFNGFAVPQLQDLLALIGIELQGEALIQRAAHQATEVLDAEPSLVGVHEGVKKAVVAGEDGWGEMRMDFGRI